MNKITISQRNFFLLSFFFPLGRDRDSNNIRSDNENRPRRRGTERFRGDINQRRNNIGKFAEAGLPLLRDSLWKIKTLN